MADRLSTKTSERAQTTNARLSPRLSGLTSEAREHPKQVLRAIAAVDGYADYIDRPVEFIREILDEDPWSDQVRIAESGRDNPQTAVPSCFGSGKDWIAARLGVWWVCTGGILVATSNSFPQLRDIFWRELRRAHAKGQLPGHPSNGTDLRWEVTKTGAFAIGRKPEDYDPEGFQGFHGSRILVIVDEANGVDALLWSATNGLVVNEASRRLAIGNPYEPQGPFFEACRLATWTVIPISVFDTPNFTGEAVPEKAQAELVSPYWLEQRRAEGLEGTPWWQAKVLGQFPDTASNAIIPLAWVELARVREPITDAREWAGLDVARFGTDDSVLVEGSGNGPESAQIVHGQDTMQVAGMGKAYLDRRRGVLAVDVIGVGGGVVDRIREQHPPGTLLAINVAEAPTRDAELLVNLRAQLWWDVRRQLDPTNTTDEPLSLARLDELTYQRLRAELTAPTYRMTSSGKVQIESKEELKARGLPTPDLADAFNLANHARSRARRRVASFGAAA
jgi:phage terminase large subunit